jgi:hypothetical protein
MPGEIRLLTLMLPLDSISTGFTVDPSTIAEDVFKSSAAETHLIFISDSGQHVNPQRVHFQKR